MNDLSPSRDCAIARLTDLRAAQAKRDEFDPRIEPFRISPWVARGVEFAACAASVVFAWSVLP
ncbi:hypothetical protein ASG17_07755 [Brevundimonas sp. Leaf363]|uniref:hypothetical protein n=1 Tax=Brevundimonas sp. Leaf363 TaxID=1736353 RepID=UPI0006F7DFE3|nr:hypothetical protein [Brevundimonas sp. Leaf363]KQS55937.1 hypothetical protein ASG17_07755 [Brevundimonas sp. Leaf363]